MRPLLAILFLSGAAAFAPARWARPLAPSQSSFCGAPHPALVARAPAASAPARRPGARAGVSAVRMGLFGLGAPEIAVIVVAAGFILGPDKLTSMAKDLGKVAGELKDVPNEFQEGLAEASDATVAPPAIAEAAKAAAEPAAPVVAEAKKEEADEAKA